MHQGLLQSTKYLSRVFTKSRKERSVSLELEREFDVWFSGHQQHSGKTCQVQNRRFSF